VETLKGYFKTWTCASLDQRSTKWEGKGRGWVDHRRWGVVPPRPKSWRRHWKTTPSIL